MSNDSIDFEREAHAVRQMRAAQAAYESLDGRTKAAIEKRGLAPVSECLPRREADEALDKHLWHLESADPIPGIEPEIVTDAKKWENQVEYTERAIREHLIIFTGLICSGLDRTGGLANAMIAILNREHVDEDSSEIARIHKAPLPLLRKMRRGIGPLIDTKREKRGRKRKQNLRAAKAQKMANMNLQRERHKDDK